MLAQKHFSVAAMTVALFAVGISTVGAEENAATGPSAAATLENGGTIRLAQECGWYAIFYCTESRGAAVRWNRENGAGHVIDSSSLRFPNFRSGYYCVVAGPMGRGAALGEARRWRDVSPTAYAKSSC